MRLIALRVDEHAAATTTAIDIILSHIVLQTIRLVLEFFHASHISSVCNDRMLLFCLFLVIQRGHLLKPLLKVGHISSCAHPLLKLLVLLPQSVELFMQLIDLLS